MGVKIFSGRASLNLATQIAEHFGQPLGDVNVTVFSDGEFQPSFEETVRGQDVFIVQSTMPPTENIFELFKKNAKIGKKFKLKKPNNHYLKCITLIIL